MLKHGDSLRRGPGSSFNRVVRESFSEMLYLGRDLKNENEPALERTGGNSFQGGNGMCGVPEIGKSFSRN